MKSIRFKAGLIIGFISALMLIGALYLLYPELNAICGGIF